MLEIKTFGCRLNFFESEMIRKLLERLSESSDWCVFNSCSITGEAFRQLKQQIRKYAKENPEKKIFITGCSAQVEFDELSLMPEIFKIIDNKNKLNISAWTDDDKVWASLFDIKEIQQIPCKEQLPEKFLKHTKAFVQIQQGCNNFCTYCIVPYSRGRSVSFDKNLIFQQLKTFINNGYKELTITGVDIASYEGNNGENLTQLISDILDEFKDYDFRLRLSSIDPHYNDYDGLFKIMKNNKKLTPYLHLSLQSGDDKVLRAMNRKHRIVDLITLVEIGRAEVENIAYGADIILGFPVETDELFENTYNTISKLKIEHLHMFPYSPRKLTSAYVLGNPILRSVKRERINKLAQLNKEYLKIRMDNMLNKNIEILSEGKWGYTDNYFKVLLDDENSRGKIINKKLLKNINEEYFICD